VGTYAYVNPVVAVALGYFLGGEEIGARTIVGTLLILVSVITITTTPKAVSTAKGKDSRSIPKLSPAKAD
jgi:drug/metabolite transporter (DMT)-like permease